MDDYEIEYQLKRLHEEHRELDESLRELEGKATIDMMEVQRIKKRKLAIKDQIATLEAMQHPDIIA